jgi:glycosyltransferase involved in cell wall biosynthesis
MSQGVPVVAARTTIDQYYFFDGSVYFFDSGSVEDLAKCIEELAVNPKLRHQLADKGRTYVKLNNWTDKQQEYLDIVDGLCGDHYFSGADAGIRVT